MLDGWYCRSLANEKATKRSSEDDAVQPDEESGSEEESQENEGLEDGQRSPQFIDDQHPAHSDHSVIKTSIDYKSQYRYLKRKLKYLIYVSNKYIIAIIPRLYTLQSISRKMNSFKMPCVQINDVSLKFHGIVRFSWIVCYSTNNRKIRPLKAKRQKSPRKRMQSRSRRGKRHRTVVRSNNKKRTSLHCYFFVFILVN